MTKCTRASMIAAIAVLLASSQLVPRITAQVLYGSVVGNVTDPSGAAGAAVTVSVTNAQTGLAREATTNDRGSFLLPDLQAGRYDAWTPRMRARSPSATALRASRML